jgi:hypothetical protein
MKGKTGIWSSGGAARAAAAMLCLLAVLAGAGCSGKTQSKKDKFWREYLEKKKSAPVKDPQMRMRPACLKPVSGAYTWKPAGKPGFSIDLPEGGWFSTSGQYVPDAVGIFVQGDRERPDIIVAVAPSDTPWPVASPAPAETPPDLYVCMGGGCSTVPQAPAETAPTLQSRAVVYFKRWNKIFTPTRVEPCPDNLEKCACVTGDIIVRNKHGNRLEHNSASLYAFDRGDGGAFLIIVTLDEGYRDMYQSYIDGIVGSFKIKM